jgi:hypothetical protein
MPVAMRRAASVIAPWLRAEGFYLAGGTAVALYYGHRRSVDLDWFRPEPFEPLTLAQQLQGHGVSLENVSIASNTLIGWLERTKVSLLGYPYPLLAPPRFWQEYQMNIAAPEDLVCMKLAAVQQRGAKRDFIDLYMLLQEIPLETALWFYTLKYNAAESASLLYALNYFEDADREPTPRLRIQLTWREVKVFLRAQARQLCT